MVICLFEFSFGSLSLSAKVVVDSARPPQFINKSEANVKRAQHERDENCEGDDLGAGINFADQLAGEFAQENLGIVAS